VIAAVHPLPRRRERDGPWRDGLMRRVRGVPGVFGVTSTEMLPSMGEMEFAAVRRETEGVSAFLDVYSMTNGEQYFTTLGIAVLRGRDFEVSDRGGKPTPAIINRALARHLFGVNDPIGARLVRGREKAEALEIMGVVADTRMRTLGEGSVPALFTPDYNGAFLVRVAGDAR
jgi:putative ABC transport system permease protein